MEIPPADPSKLLASWMEWENGETAPGRVLSNLKTGGLRTVLEVLVASTQEAAAKGAVPSAATGTEPEPAVAPHEEPAATGD